MRTLACKLAALSLLALAGTAAQAHQAPNSVVSLDFGAGAVCAEIFVPVSELAAAATGSSPEAVGTYLLNRVSMETPAGVRWNADLRNLRRTSADGHDYWVALFDFTPPAGASARELVFIDDAVTHEVRNHVVTVLVRSDAVLTKDTAGPQLLGVLQYPARSLTIRRATQNSH